MDIHYNRHHKTYLTNLNAALATHADALSAGDLVKQLELQSAIKFNAGGHINHTLFWQSLAPASTGVNDPSSAPQLSSAIAERWITIGAFKAAFEAVALAIQGSGWVWLVKDASSPELELTISKDQDLPGSGKMVVLGVDMWEHAYYLQYFNNKKEYLTNIWQVVNWKTAEARFVGDRKSVYGPLVGLASRL
jgi:superoxide dismutase, Fe-Mn family